MKSIITDDSDACCYICGCGGALQLHHCLHGSRRKMADKYGLTVHLCPTCHADIHDKGILDLALEQRAQRAFEARYGHEEFMKVFGKNYI